MQQPIIPPAPAAMWRRLAAAAGLWLVGGVTTGALAAEAYPFEGSWILPQHTCVADSVHLRTYTAREVISPRGRCTIRRVAQGAGAFELQEDCRHEGRTSTITETIRMTSPDTMLLKRQLVRLKIPRQVHYVRCSAVAGSPAPPPAAGASFRSGRATAAPHTLTAGGHQAALRARALRRVLSSASEE